MVMTGNLPGLMVVRQRRTHNTCSVEDWVSPRIGLDPLEKKITLAIPENRTKIPRSASPYLVTVLTALFIGSKYF
jgi:hypothetical protein